MATLHEALMMCVDRLQCGQADEAEHICGQILAVDPDNPSAVFLLGVAQAQQGKLAAAQSSLSTAALRAPANPDVHLNLGRVRYLLGRPAEAEADLRACLALAPDNPAAKIELTKVFNLSRNFPAAKALASEILSLHPQAVDAYAALSEALREEGAPEEAERHARDGLRRAPENPQLHCELGMSLLALSRPDDAVISLTAATRYDPRCWKAHFNLCRILLALGRLEEAWFHLDQGYAAYPDGPFAERARGFPYPRWTGESLVGKRLRVWQPYVIGEEILYAGVYAEAATAARQVIIDATPKLIPLLRRSFPDITFTPRSYPPLPDSPPADLQCNGLDLLRRLRPDRNAFPPPRAYLTAAPADVADSRRHLASLGPGPKIGISWNSASTGDKRKSITPESLVPLLRLPGFIFVNIQYGDRQEEIRRLRDEHGVTLHSPGDFDLFENIDRLAGLIAALDGVVTIPNINAHLANALNIPTILLAKGFMQNFSLQGSRSLWHPSIYAIVRKDDDPTSIDRSVQEAAHKLAENFNNKR